MFPAYSLMALFMPHTFAIAVSGSNYGKDYYSAGEFNLRIVANSSLYDKQYVVPSHTGAGLQVLTLAEDPPACNATEQYIFRFLSETYVNEDTRPSVLATIQGGTGNLSYEAITKNNENLYLQLGDFDDSMQNFTFEYGLNGIYQKNTSFNPLELFDSDAFYVCPSNTTGPFAVSSYLMHADVNETIPGCEPVKLIQYLNCRLYNVDPVTSNPQNTTSGAACSVPGQTFCPLPGGSGKNISICDGQSIFQVPCYRNGTGACIDSGIGSSNAQCQEMPYDWSLSAFGV